MKLKEYFDKYRTPIRAFARECGCTPPTIHNILNAKSDIHLGLAMAIEKVTHGEVTVYDLAEEIERKHFKKKNFKSLDKKDKE